MIYFISELERDTVKIGYSKDRDTLIRRFNGMRTGNSSELKVIKVIKGGMGDEFNLHKQFKNHHIRGEWFHLDDEIIEFIKPKQTIVRMPRRRKKEKSFFMTKKTNHGPQKKPRKTSEKIERTIKELTLFIQECLDTLGFFHHELIIGGNYFEAFGVAPEMSKGTYKRRILSAIHLLGLESKLLHINNMNQLRILRIYGSTESARKHLK